MSNYLGTDEAEIINEVLKEFVVAAKYSLAEVEAAVTNGCLADIRAAAHGAKGEAVGAAANKLGHLYSDMEQLAREGNQTRFAELIILMASAVDRIDAYVNRRMVKL